MAVTVLRSRSCCNHVPTRQKVANSLEGRDCRFQRGIASTAEYVNLISFVPEKGNKSDNVKQEPATQNDNNISGEEAKAFYESLISEPADSVSNTERIDSEISPSKRVDRKHRKQTKTKTYNQERDKRQHDDSNDHSSGQSSSYTCDRGAHTQIPNIHSHRDEKRLLLYSQTGELRSIKKLFKTNPSVDIDYQDSFGWTALMCAAVAGKTKVVDFLLKNGADKLIRNSKNQIASSLAREAGFKTIQHKIEQFSDESSDNDTERKRDPFFCKTCKSTFQESTFKEHQTSTLHLFNMNIKPNIDTYMIPKSNIGYRLMTQSGWDGEKGLGPEGKGQRLPVKTILKRDRHGLGSKSDSKKQRVTHFGSYDTSATSSIPGTSGRVMSATTIGRRERRKREQREKEWERNLRQSMDF